MSGVSLILDGSENLKKIFTELPEKGYRQPVMAAFRKAAKPMQQSIRNNLPANLAGLKKAISIKAYKSKEPLLAVGAFRKGQVYQNQRGQNWNPYMLLYWQNYGTLANRLASHDFRNPRRKDSANWKGGIRPGKFFESGIEQGLPGAERIFREEFESGMTKFLEDNAVK